MTFNISGIKSVVENAKLAPVITLTDNQKIVKEALEFVNANDKELNTGGWANLDIVVALVMQHDTFKLSDNSTKEETEKQLSKVRQIVQSALNVLSETGPGAKLENPVCRALKEQTGKKGKAPVFYHIYTDAFTRLQERLTDAKGDMPDTVAVGDGELRLKSYTKDSAE